MDLSITTATDDDYEAIIEADARAFAFTPTPEETAAARAIMDLSRFRVVRSEGEVVGIGGSFALELTLPGGHQIPMSGVTWISVAVTHRRRGVLRQLMESLHADAAERGEPLLGLGASEGGIYERFGYGVATKIWVVSIDQRRAEFIEASAPEPGSIRLVDGRKAIPEILKSWEAFRVGAVGEIQRSQAWYELSHVHEKQTIVAALHEHGHAVWTVANKWNDGHPAHELNLHELVATTPEAYQDLWKTVLSVDLVGETRTVFGVAPTDPLPHLLTDPRLVRTVELNDGLWLNPADPVATFGARDYRIDDSLVVAIDSTSYRISQDGATETSDAHDLQVTRAGAGSLLLGGVSATELARAGKLTSSTPEILHRADAFFGWEPRAHLRTGF